MGINDMSYVLRCREFYFMAASSVSVRAGAPVRSANKSDKGLRLVRFLFVAIALGAGAALPFELGALPLPAFLRPPTPSIVSLTNYPRTAVVGSTEKFSVRLAGSAHAPLTYILVYPNKRRAIAHVRADATGYSSHTFRLNGYKLHHWRETALIGVEDSSGNVKAFLRFAIQRRG